MSIIVLTPKPPQSVAAVSTDESLSAHLASDFLHLLGQEGRRFDSFEQLRDYAQARIDAASLAAKIEAPVVEAPVVEAPVVEAPVVEAPVVEAPVVEAPVVEAPVDPAA